MESLNDESVVKEAGLILTFLFSHATVDAIEAVAAILNEKKGISGSEIRAIVDSEWSELDRGQFSRKEEAARRWKKGVPNYVIIDPISKRIKGPKGGYPLVCLAIVGDDPLWGKDIPCNHYPYYTRVRLGVASPARPVHPKRIGFKCPQCPQRKR